MIDIHSHILNEVDDGSVSLENSIEILKKAEEAGFTDIILTPHFIEGYYENIKSEISPKIKELKQAVYDENIEVTLHHGNEIFLSENTPKLVYDCKAATLANTRYVLFEVPFTTKMMNLEEILNQLIEMGCIPIIAHPERFNFIQEDPSSLIRLLKMGVLAQSNYGSFIGMYGKEAKKTAEILLENRLIQFLGSDTHRHGQIYENIDKIIKKIESITDDSKYIYDLTTNNPRSVLEDMDIYVEFPETLKEKKNVFFFF